MSLCEVEGCGRPAASSKSQGKVYRWRFCWGHKSRTYDNPDKVRCDKAAPVRPYRWKGEEHLRKLKDELFDFDTSEDADEQFERRLRYARRYATVHVKQLVDDRTEIRSTGKP